MGLFPVKIFWKSRVKNSHEKTEAKTQEQTILRKRENDVKSYTTALSPKGNTQIKPVMKKKQKYGWVPEYRYTALYINSVLLGFCLEEGWWREGGKTMLTALTRRLQKNLTSTFL